MSVGVVLTDAASIAIAGGGVAALIGWGLRNSWRGIKRWTRFLDDYEGTPARPGVDARPGVMTRLQAMEASTAQQTDILRTIMDELPKNGVPLAHKIDKLWSKYLTDEEREHA